MTAHGRPQDQGHQASELRRAKFRIQAPRPEKSLYYPIQEPIWLLAQEIHQLLTVLKKRSCQTRHN